MWSFYVRLISFAGDKVSQFLFHPKIDSFIAKKTSLKHEESRRVIFATVWIIISVITMVATWYIYAYNNGGVKKALDEYDTRLPRISYTGANRPAYFLFCTLIPIGCLLIRSPIVNIMSKITLELVNLGLPFTSYCHCFWCCCCCCIDSSRFKQVSAKRQLNVDPSSSTSTTVVINRQANISSSHEVASAGLTEWESMPSGSCQCWPPYLVYMVMALNPLAELSIHGLVVLSTVSISFTSIGRAIHLLGALSFFYGMCALEGCWVLSLKQIHQIWPDQFGTIFGFDLKSKRYRAHMYLFISKVFVFVAFDYLMVLVTYIIGTETGNWGGLKFQLRYVTALSQWTMVSLVVLSVFAFSYDIDAFLERSKERNKTANMIPVETPSPSLSTTIAPVSPSTTAAAVVQGIDSGPASIDLVSENDVEMQTQKVEPDTSAKNSKKGENEDKWASSVFD